MQRLKDTLAMTERTTKAQAQLKDKFKLRLKLLEDGLNNVSCGCGSPKPAKSSNIFGLLTRSNGVRKRSTSQSMARLSVETKTANTMIKQANKEEEKNNDLFHSIKEKWFGNWSHG